jgi:hypothetical protein
MEWSKGMILRDYAIGLLQESSRRHGQSRITMTEAMAEARMARLCYRIMKVLGLEAKEEN